MRFMVGRGTDIDDCLVTVDKEKELDTKGNGRKTRKVGRALTIGKNRDRYNGE